MKYAYMISGALCGTSLLLGAASMVNIPAVSSAAPPASQIYSQSVDSTRSPGQLKPEPYRSSEPVAAEDQYAPAQPTEASQAISAPGGASDTTTPIHSQAEITSASNLATMPAEDPPAVPIYRSQDGVRYQHIGLEWIRTDLPEECGAPDPQTNDYRDTCKMPPDH